MKTLLKLGFLAGIFLGSFFLVQAATVFYSNQVGNSQANGYVLQTNGSNVSTWVATSTLGITSSGSGTISTSSPLVSGQPLYATGLSTIASVASSTFLTSLGTIPTSQGGTGTTTWQTGSIPFYNGTTFTENNPNLFWDNTNNRLGVGTNVPATSLQVSGLTNNNKIQADVGINFYRVPQPPSSAIALVTASGNVDAGQHYYYITYYTALGETNLVQTNPSSVTTDAAHGQVTVTLPVSTDYRVIGRKIYRTTANSLYYANVKLVATIADNTTTSYTDNIADASLTGTNYYYQENTTNKFITVDGTSAMLLGSNNTFYGLNAGQNITTGGRNVILGNAGQNLTTGTQNVINGWNAAVSATTQNNFVALGYNSLSKGQTSSVGVGYSAGQNGNGANNIFVGVNSGVGASGATFSNTISIGPTSFYGLNTGNNSVALGENSGRFIADGVTQTTISNNSLFLGTNAFPLADGDINETAIGYNVIGNGSNSVTIGNGSVTKTILQGSVGIGTTTPYSKLTVWGPDTGTTALANFVNSASTTLMTILDNGNVGVGTAAPSFSLDINNSTGSTNPDLRITGSVAPVLRIDSTNSNSANRNWGFITNAVTYGDFSIKQSTSQGGDPITGTSPLYINPSGVVSLLHPLPIGSGGTNTATTPDTNAFMFFDGTKYTDYPQIKYDGAGSFQVNDGTSQGTTFQKNGIFSVFTGQNMALGGSGTLAFDTYNAGWKTRMYIDNTGNIGIGTTGTSGSLLSLVSNSSTNNIFIVATTSAKSLGFIDAKGNQYTGGDPITLSSCGTSPTVAAGSNNNAGRIVVGSGVVTSCVVNFADGGWTATANAPACDANTEGGITVFTSASTTATSMTITGASAINGDTITYQCHGF